MEESCYPIVIAIIKSQSCTGVIKMISEDSVKVFSHYKGTFVPFFPFFSISPVNTVFYFPKSAEISLLKALF